MDDQYHMETLAVRAGTLTTEFGENSEALFLNSSFRFKSAAQAAARFGGKEPGNIYSRFTNPTVTMFQDKLSALEGAEQCVATSSGMSAVAEIAATEQPDIEQAVINKGIRRKFGMTAEVMADVGRDCHNVASLHFHIIHPQT